MVTKAHEICTNKIPRRGISLPPWANFSKYFAHRCRKMCYDESKKCSLHVYIRRQHGYFSAFPINNICLLQSSLSKKDLIDLAHDYYDSLWNTRWQVSVAVYKQRSASVFFIDTCHTLSLSISYTLQHKNHESSCFSFFSCCHDAGIYHWCQKFESEEINHWWRIRTWAQSTRLPSELLGR